MKLRKELHMEMERIQCKNRVAVDDDRGNDLCRPDESTIVSGLPAIRLTTGKGLYSGRRKRIRIERGRGPLTVLVRTRPLPSGLREPSVIQWGVDRKGQRVPLSVADGATRTIHQLLESESCETEPERARRTVRDLGQMLFEEPLRHLLDADGEPVVGSEVSERVRGLMSWPRWSTRIAVEREVWFLERLASGEILPRRLARRLEMLRRFSSRAKGCKEVRPDEVGLEVERLLCLVRSRACIALRFDEGRITGLLSPREVSRDWRQRLLGFCLQPRGNAGLPALQVWDPRRAIRERRRVCLGEAGHVIREMDDARDVYGMVDTVLNYIETNRIGCGSRRGEGSLSRLLEDLL